MVACDPYTGHLTSEAETVAVFRQAWVFVGMTTFAKKKNDFFSRRVGGESLITRFDGNGFRSFINRCPHRGAQLFTDACGNGDLTCPFHGWHFNDEGMVSAIPFEKSKYCFDVEVRSKLRLEEVHTKTIGKFIFINLSEAPIDINDQLPQSIIDTLVEVSMVLDDSYSLSRIPAACNWKLLAEIVFDELHVPFVHANTFAKILKYETNAKIDVDGNLHRDTYRPSMSFSKMKNLMLHKMSQLSFSIGTANPQFKMEAWHDCVERFRDKNYYYDVFVFPNLHFISASGGFSFSYCAYFPEAVAATTVDYFFTTGRVKKPSQLIPIAHLESVRAGLTIYEEDILMMENVQSATNTRVFFPNHGSYESSIVKWRSFFREYCNG